MVSARHHHFISVRIPGYAGIPGALLFALAALSLACMRPAGSTLQPAAAPAQRSTSALGGHLVLIGGGERPAEVIELFVRLAAGGPIVILPLASDDSRDAGTYYTELFRQHGATQIQVIHLDSRADAERPEHAAAIARAGGVFFAGGDQRRIAIRVVATAVHEALFQLRARGGVIGGTSAGTACQSELMLTGDGELGVIQAANVMIVRGLGQTPGVVLDQHFVARQRNNRLISVVLEHPDHLGMGIDEATAAWFKPDGTVEVVGRGAVILYDATGAQITRAGRGALLGVSDMKQHILVPGQRFDLGTRTILQGKHP